MRITLAQHLGALALVVADVVVRAVRIQQLLPVALGRAIVVNTCGDALAAVTPARLGGEPIRFVGFQRSGASAAAVLAAFATEACVDAVLLLLITAFLTPALAGSASVWLARLVRMAAAPPLRWVTVAVLAAMALGAGVAVRYRRSLPITLLHPLRDAWRLLRSRSPVTLASVAGLTVVSMAARTAILPVLAARVPGTSLAGLVAGSFALVFGQVVLPLPAGAGGVELGFVAGFAGTLPGREIATLLLVWRFYTVGLGVLVGAVLLGRAGWQRAWRWPASPGPNGPPKAPTVTPAAPAAPVSPGPPGPHCAAAPLPP